MAYNPNNPNGQAVAANSAPNVLAIDQGELPVTASPAIILSAPTANSMAALNAAVQYNVEAGANYFVTLTNSAAATAAWVGTVSFEYTLNGGGAWSALTAIPVAGPSGSTNATTATANGLWIVMIPTGVGSQTVGIRARMSAYTSGTAQFFVAPCGSPNAAIVMPWVYSVTSGNTIMGPIDASGLSEISIQLSAVTTTGLTAQGTNDPSLTTWQTIPVQDVNGTVSAATMTAALTYKFSPSGYKWVRIQCTTTGTVLTVQGLQAKLGSTTTLSSTGSSINAIIASGTVTNVTTVATVTTVSTVSNVAAIAAGANAIGDMGVQYRANATGAAGIISVLSPATPAAATIKASAGRLIGWQLTNSAAAVRSVKLFNASAPTLGTTAAVMEIDIAAGGRADFQLPGGIGFATACTYSVTSAKGLTDNTATGLVANDVSGSFFFA